MNLLSHAVNFRFALLCLGKFHLHLDKDDLDNVVPVPPLDQDDVPLNAIEPDEDNDTDVEDELDDFDEESDEEDVFLNEYLMDNEGFSLSLSLSLFTAIN
jgi:hypothetical protein